ncbi:MAG: hypothetical protein RLZZ385_996 [Pseudomonadota bacterium]|jgi:CBS domain containing-hemolysin-like protein
MDAAGFPSDPSLLLRIVLQILLFGASAFFSGSETALFSLTRFDLQRLGRNKHPLVGTLQRLLDQPRRLIVAILCGNELVNIAAAANMTTILASLFGVQTAAWAATFVMIPLILLLGEVTPKTLAVSNPVWVSTRIIVTPLSMWTRLIAPLSYMVRAVADYTTTLLIGPERKRENILHIEELQTLIDEGVTSGELSRTERTLVHSLLHAGATEIRQIMTLRSEVSFIDGALPPRDMLREFVALRHARVPVYLEDTDNVIGFLHAEDLPDWNAELEKDAESPPILHPSLAVSPTKEVDEMLDFFAANKARAALVVNEFGAVDGVITIADVTGFLFADMLQSSTPEAQGILQEEDHVQVQGNVTLAELRHATGIDIEEPLMTTVAGMALRHFGSVPKVGDVVEIDGYRLEVLAMDNLRIASVRLHRRQAGKQAAEASPHE